MKKNFKITAVILLCSIMGFFANAQVTFTKKPNNQQLYVRDVATNTAQVKIQGSVGISTGYTGLELTVKRFGVTQYVLPLTLNYSTGTEAPFDFSAPIVAEKAEYSFELRSNNGTLLMWEQEIVAGDAYFVSGQSNVGHGSGMPFSQNNNQYIRWCQGTSWGWGTYYMGGIPFSFADSICNGLGIPVAFINTANGGQNIEFFQRNDLNPNDASTNYGWAKNTIEFSQIDSFRAFIWYQGESNSAYNTTDYKTNFHALFDDWKSDFNFSKLYIFQVKGCNLQTIPQLDIAEYIRQLPSELPATTIVSTNGVPNEPDGCHFTYYDGYKVLANRLFGLVKHQIYGQGTDDGIYSPDATGFYFTNSSKTTVQFVITPMSNVPVWESGSHTNFFFSNPAIEATSGTLSGNVVTLELNAPFTDANPTIGHLANASTAVPIIRNQNGIGLLSFKYRPISATVPVSMGLLSFEGINYGHENVLEWEIENNAARSSRFILEESEDAIYFKPVNHFVKEISQTAQNQFSAKVIAPAIAYYRLRIQAEDGAFSFSGVVKLTKKGEQVSIYPNPTQQAWFLGGIKSGGKIFVVNMLGQTVLSQAVEGKGIQEINSSNLPVGNYQIVVQSGGQRLIFKAQKID